MRGVRSAANALDYAIVIRETRQSMMSADEINATLESKQADGLVLLNNMTFVARQLDGANHPHLQPPAVQIDNAAAAREMTEYLIGQGHRHIGMICGRKKPSFAERERGFRKTMQEARLKINNSWIFDSENSLDGARSAARRILACGNRPTAMFCVSVPKTKPNTPRAIDEAFRVLKPGGVAKIMIYHKYSMVGYMLWLRYALLKLRPATSMKEIYSQYLESQGTKAYSQKEARELFCKFQNLKLNIHLTHGDLLTSSAGQRHEGSILSIARLIWPRWLIRKFFKNHGLFMTATGTK